MKWIRFQPPGPGCSPSLMARPAELFGPESRSRRFPRCTSANAGAAFVSTSTRRAGVEGDGGVDVVDQVPHADGFRSHWSRSSWGSGGG